MKANYFRLLSSRKIRLPVTILAIAVAGLISTSPHAEPYIAIREGYKCSKCHVNMTGGGKRTEFGNIYTLTRLAGTYIKFNRPDQTNDDDQETAEPSTSSFFNGRLNDFIAIGGDFRTVFQFTDTPNQDTENEFIINKSVIYLQVDLIPGNALLYWTAPGGVDAREIFALVRLSSNYFYLKAGQFFLPYGLRIQDDTAFIRATTGFTYSTTDVGMELGIEPGPLTLNLALTNGTGASGDNNRDKRVTLRASVVGRYSRLGASYSDNKKQDNSRNTTYNIFGGLHFGRFTLLGEADRISDEDTLGVQTEQLAALAELNFLLSRGVNFKLTYDFLDPNEDVNNDERERFSLVYEHFLMQYTQIRSGIRVNKGIPQDDLQNAKEFFFELHLFF